MRINLFAVLLLLLMLAVPSKLQARWIFSGSVSHGEPTMGHVLIGYQKKRLAFAISGSNFGMSKTVGYGAGLEDSLSIRSSDAAFLLGYWSNREKKHPLGWHFATGAGPAFTNVRGSYFSAQGLTGYNIKVLCGGEWYFLRKERHALSLTLDVLGSQLTTKLTPQDPTDKNQYMTKFLRSALMVGISYFWG